MILIIDDDAAVRSTLTYLLTRSGWEAKAVASPAEALETVRRTVPRLILMDMNYSVSTTGEEGLELLQKVKIFVPATPVILMTAWGSIRLAVEGMRLGAFDFITKPWDNPVLVDRIRTALQLSDGTEQEGAAPVRFDGIVGKSPLLREVLDAVACVAPTNASVLITGESGTGKELIAEAIHANSPRAGKPFVKVNLGGLSQTLFESEMFGHRKGAFTDACTDRVGRFELADGGTIFLDEIGELDLTSQVKLLRVLQDRTFEVLGDSRTRRTDVRVVTATNRDLSEMVAAGRFREDLFYRINLIPIRLPALRERREDIPLLVKHFADGVRPGAEFTSEAMAYLQRLPYPGNIRELKNLVERTLILCGNRPIAAEDVRRCQGPSAAGTALPSAKGPSVFDRAETLDEMERRRIVQALSDCSGNLTRVALCLGISRAALYRKLEKYGLGTK